MHWFESSKGDESKSSHLNVKSS